MKYHYKALVENPECGVRRAVVFNDDRFLRWSQVDKEAPKHMSSQTCVRCGENHKRNDFCIIELERGEPDRDGTYYWRDVQPDYRKDNQMELPV